MKRAWSRSIGFLALLACSPADDQPDADVLGDSFASSASASEGESETGPQAECLPPLEAMGVGDCVETLGYQWGPECEPIIGCECKGSGCATLFTDVAECRHTYGHCDPCEACTADQACVITCGHLANDFEDILCVDMCEGCSICPSGYNSAIGCGLIDPPTELPHTECHIED